MVELRSPTAGHGQTPVGLASGEDMGRHATRDAIAALQAPLLKRRNARAPHSCSRRRAGPDSCVPTPVASGAAAPEEPTNHVLD